MSLVKQAGKSGLGLVGYDNCLTRSGSRVQFSELVFSAKYIEVPVVQLDSSEFVCGRMRGFELMKYGSRHYGRVVKALD